MAIIKRMYPEKKQEDEDTRQYITNMMQELCNKKWVRRKWWLEKKLIELSRNPPASDEGKYNHDCMKNEFAWLCDVVKSLAEKGELDHYGERFRQEARLYKKKNTP